LFLVLGALLSASRFGCLLYGVEYMHYLHRRERRRPCMPCIVFIRLFCLILALLFDCLVFMAYVVFYLLEGFILVSYRRPVNRLKSRPTILKTEIMNSIKIHNQIAFVKYFVLNIVGHYTYILKY